MNIPDHIFESLEPILGLKILKFFEGDPDPLSGIFLSLDPGSGMVDPGSLINIQVRISRNKTPIINTVIFC